jgi:hypothetical protein
VNTFNRQLNDAQNSVPGKVTMGIGVLMFLLALVSLVVNLTHGHG